MKVERNKMRSLVMVSEGNGGPSVYQSLFNGIIGHFGIVLHAHLF